MLSQIKEVLDKNNVIGDIIDDKIIGMFYNFDGEVLHLQWEEQTLSAVAFERGKIKIELKGFETIVYFIESLDIFDTLIKKIINTQKENEEIFKMLGEGEVSY